MSKKKKPQQKKQQKSQQKPASQLAKPQQISKEKKRQEAQRRFVERKKNAQTVAQISSNVSSNELETLKAVNEHIIREANHRIEMIQASGYTSRAIHRLENESDQLYFNIDDVTSREELIQELTRARVFINDDGSTLLGAKVETAQISAEQYRGKFGNEYFNKENNYARFDIKSIDPQTAEKVFDSYRKLESIRQSQMANDGGYGSENLIIALYDAEIRGMDSLVYGADLLDAFKEKNDVEYARAKEYYDMSTVIKTEVVDNIAGRYLF